MDAKNHPVISVLGDQRRFVVPIFSASTPDASTKAHELTHWTGHETRLARTFGKRFGDDNYSREELVAAFLCADLRVRREPREDHAAYIEHWLGILKEDKRANFSAAVHVQRAADLLHALQPQQSGVAA